MNETERRIAFKCYVCGQPIGDSFIVWSLSEDSDRAFLACLKCEGRLDQPFTLHVTTQPKD